MISILDYGMGNTRSVLNAFNLLGEKCIITNKRSDITNSEVIILPGVGAFSEGMTNIKQNGLLEIFIPLAEEAKPKSIKIK